MSKRRGFQYAVIGINIKTGETLHWPSVKAAADWAGKSLNWANRRIREKILWKGHYLGYLEEEDSIRKLVSALRGNLEANKAPAAPKDETGYVYLQIDNRTKILVPKERNTPEYAQYYRNRRAGLKMPSFEEYLISIRRKFTPKDNEK